MKIIEMQYPDGKIHKVEIYDIFQTIDNEIILEFFDLSDNRKDSFTPIIKVNGTWTKNPNHQNFSFYEKRKIPEKTQFVKSILNELPNRINLFTNEDFVQKVFEEADKINYQKQKRKEIVQSIINNFITNVLWSKDRHQLNEYDKIISKLQTLDFQNFTEKNFNKFIEELKKIFKEVFKYPEGIAIPTLSSANIDINELARRIDNLIKHYFPNNKINSEKKSPTAVATDNYIGPPTPPYHNIKIESLVYHEHEKEPDKKREYTYMQKKEENIRDFYIALPPDFLERNPSKGYTRHIFTPTPRENTDISFDSLGYKIPKVDDLLVHFLTAFHNNENPILCSPTYISITDDITYRCYFGVCDTVEKFNNIYGTYITIHIPEDWKYKDLYCIKQAAFDAGLAGELTLSTNYGDIFYDNGNYTKKGESFKNKKKR